MDDLALQGATATARVLSGASWTTREATIASDFAAGTALTSLLAGDNGFGGSSTPLYQIVDTWNATFTAKFQAAATLAANTLIKMADNDNSPSGLQQRTLQFALTYLVNQMTTNGTTVNATTVSVGAQTAVGTPAGNPTIVVGSKNGLGQTLQYANGETLTFTCSADSYTGSQTKNQEQVTVLGQAAVTPSYSYLWPGGSGVSKVYNAVDPTKYNQGAALNALTNGDFANFSNTNYPDNWVITVGAATTNFAKATSPVYFGSNSLQILGAGGTLSAINQPFNTAAATAQGAGGTPYKLLPQTVYCANLFYQMSAASPASGVLALEVVDGNNTIIQNSQSVNQTTNVALTGVADTNWHALNLVFSLPAAPPVSPAKLRIRLSTDLPSGKSVYIAGVSCNPMTALYQGGPPVSIFAGSTPLLLSDQWTVGYTPTWGVFQQMLQRLFNLNALGLTIPATSSSPTVADSLVA